MTAAPASSRPPIGFAQLVALVAMLMALNALAIDTMLPALPQIGEALGVDRPNDRQWVITAYLIGFGVAQLFYGVASDRFGRKPVLMIGVSLYVLFSFLAAAATSLETMMLARALQGVGAASTRVLAVAIVRDCFGGRQMARVMSLAFLVFLAVPVIAPSLGALIVWVAPWPWIFVVLGLWGLAVQIWALWSLPETLHPEDRMPVQAARVLDAFRVTLTTRRAVGYMLAMAAILGCLFGFINSSQQIFADVFGEAQLFPIIFAIIAGFIAAASLLNARLVERLGMRRISHAALLGFVAFSAGHLVAALAGFETLVVFSVLQAAVMFCFGLIMGNFGAMAMEPLGRIAGTASSVQGFVTTLGGAAGGYVIGQLFDGTTAPLAGGFLICGLTALGFVLWAEGGRLFGSQAPAGA